MKLLCRNFFLKTNGKYPFSHMLYNRIISISNSSTCGCKKFSHVSKYLDFINSKNCKFSNGVSFSWAKEVGLDVKKQRDAEAERTTEEEKEKEKEKEETSKIEWTGRKIESNNVSEVKTKGELNKFDMKKEGEEEEEEGISLIDKELKTNRNVEHGVVNQNIKINKENSKELPEECGFKYEKHEPTMFGDWCHNCRVTDF